MEVENKSIIIDIEPLSRRVTHLVDNSLYETLIKLNIPISSLCGGSGTCGKCKLLIQTGGEYFNQPTTNEKQFLSEEDIKNGWRLGCETRIDEKCIQELEKITSPQFRIYLPNESLLEDFKILTNGLGKGIKLNPAIKKIFLEVLKPSLKNPIPDVERLIGSILNKDINYKNKVPITIDFNILNELPHILRENNHKVTVILHNNKITACESGDTTKDYYGIAFDIGTTTVVGYLINLNNGKIYAVDSKLNSQTAFGEDLITRLTFIKDNKNNLQLLNSVILKDLNQLIRNTCKEANVNPSNIYEATVVGNSVMHHIFLGISPVNIGLSPFIPIIQKALNVKARKLNLNISKNGNVYCAPIIAGFVGADTIGVILSSNIEHEKELTLAIDIGTNGEIIIGNRKVLIVGSCAAGSALEGAHISDGMRAASGAIDSVKIDTETLNVFYTTIGNKDPIGICGSGLVDAVAEMLKSKIITRSGSFSKEFQNHSRFIKKDKNIEFILANKDETSIKKNITITQNDIRQIQMAKAAFYSGMRVIINDLNKKLNINQVFLAGAFGNYINASNAKFIGMIPDIPDEKIFQIGNAAGKGAQYCLLNRDIRDKAQQLLNKIQYVEIAIKNDFQKEYAEAMYFPHLNLNYFPNLKEYNNIPKR